MRGLGPYEIVTSVVGWSNHDVVYGQRFECPFENRTWQVWAVAVECDGAPLMTFCEVRKHRSEARSKTFALLRNYAHLVACRLRELVRVRLRAHDRNFHIFQGLR